MELARKGEGWTSPNPMVGAVIVKEGRVIGEGYHARCGGPHAERQAIASLRESAEGATLYVTLEPCCHHGKTSPCTEAILEQGIGRVVIGSRDPNPLVAGKGAAMLRAAGVQVEEDFLREECDRLNPVFFHYITRGTPYVVMKYAMTADGKIAARTGASRWVTGEAARREVQKLRHRYRGIMVGIGTVLTDDPMLNCRLEGKRSPVRIVCDSRLRIPLGAQLCRTARAYPTIVACAGEPEAGPETKAAGAPIREPRGSGSPGGAAHSDLMEFAWKRRALEDMGVTKPQVILSADPTVILPAAPAQVVDGILESQGIDPHGRYIGFALRPWPGFEAKAAVFGAAADYAYETYGLTPVFLPIERRLDVGAAQLAAQHMKAPHYILPQTGRSDHTIGLFARMQAVVSMRLHALVFSAGQGVPLVGVVYDQKISSFLSYIGQDLYTGLDEVTEEALRAHIDAACARIGDEAFLSGGVERLRQVERRNSETARMLLER